MASVPDKNGKSAKKYRRVTLQVKVKTLKQLNEGKDIQELASKLGVRVATIKSWEKDTKLGKKTKIVKNLRNPINTGAKAVGTQRPLGRPK